MGRGSGTSLAPGFRFHPTDEELVRYYLKRKVSGKPLRYDPISDVDVYKCEPWDLPDKAKLKSRDLEWYFFSALDKKYGNGSKTNRATENGYWKTTGKDRPIYQSSRVVGMKKTLVYHSGRAPRGQRSNWVMHEYRMTDEQLEKAGIAQDAFVLCRIFQKSGPGPKNGEQYGAPFVEEEWEEEIGGLFPGQEVMMDEVAEEEDTKVERDEIDQNATFAIEPESAPVPVEFHYGSSSNDNQQSEEIDGHYQTLPEDMGESQVEELQYEDNKFFIIPEEYEMDVKPVKREFAAQPADDVSLGGSSSFPIGPFMDVADNPLPGDDLSLNELSYKIEYPDGFNVDDYLTFYDADEDNLMIHDSSQLMMSNDVSSEPLQPLEDVGGEIEVPEMDMHPSVSNENNEASSSQHISEPKDLKPDFKHSFLKQASHMLGNFPAPSACASDYPIKGSALRLNSAANASSSVHVTAGMIRIRNLTFSSSSIEWSVGKNGELNIVLSFGLYQDDVVPGPASAYTPSLLPNKMPSVVSWSWAIVLVLWVLIMAGSFKVGMSVCSR